MSPELTAVLIPLIIATTAYIARQYPAKRSFRQFVAEPENQAIIYDAVKLEQARRDAGRNGGKTPLSPSSSIYYDSDPRHGLGR